MRKLICALLFTLIPGAASAADIKVKIEGTLSDSLTLLQALNENGREYDLHYKLADERFDYRIATYSEGFKASGLVLSSGAANASAAILTSDCKLLFIVSRSGRATQRGALNAVAKEINKRLANYIRATKN